MSSLNRVTLIGNVGKTPEVRITGNGKKVAAFSIATTDRYKSGDEWKDVTEWHNITCWLNLAEVVENHVSKGDQLYIEGRITTRSWEDKDGNKRYTTEIVANNILFLRKKETIERETGTGAEPPTGNYERTGKLDREQIQDDTPTDSDSLPF